MPELGSLINDKPEELEVEVNGLVVSVAYHPARITPLWLSKAMQTDDPLAMAQALADVMSDWDVYENGQPIPLNAETLASFPYPVLADFSAAIGEAASGGAEGNVSSTSRSTGEPASTTPSSTGTNQNSVDTSRPVATST